MRKKDNEDEGRKQISKGIVKICLISHQADWKKRFSIMKEEFKKKSKGEKRDKRK